MTTNTFQKWIDRVALSDHAQGARSAIRINNPTVLKKWIYVLGAVLASVWTLLLWGAYALLGLGEAALHASSRFFAMDAQIVTWLTSFIGGAQQLGNTVILIVWGLGMAVLVFAAWLGQRLIRVFASAPVTREIRVN